MITGPGTTLAGVQVIGHELLSRAKNEENKKFDSWQLCFKLIGPGSWLAPLRTTGRTPIADFHFSSAPPPAVLFVSSENVSPDRVWFFFVGEPINLITGARTPVGTIRAVRNFAEADATAIYELHLELRCNPDICRRSEALKTCGSDVSKLLLHTLHISVN